MRTRFIHAADIHLGYEQYNLPARADDFARAYVSMVDYAIEHGVDFVLIAGDLFHRSNADAWMLTQASHGLTMLREAGIPAIAIEGNHDTQHARKNLSWMQFLCDQDLLTLLNIVSEPNGYRSLAPFDRETRRGSWIDIGGTRIYGIKYYGAITGRILEEVGEQIEAGRDHTVMMLHAGMDGQVPNLHGGLSLHQLEPLRLSVDYLALGHIHKRLLGLDGWIYNPGSIETNSMDELAWPHGFFDVRVDTEKAEKHQVQAIETPTLRPFLRISVNASGTRDLDEYVELVESKVAATEPVAERAVVELHLAGVGNFKRQEVPTERLKRAIEVVLSPLVVRVRNNIVPPGALSVRQGDGITRADLERNVVEQLVYQDGHYRDSASAWARLVLEVKKMAVDKDLPASIVEHVQSTVAAMSEDRELRDQKSEQEPPPGEKRSKDFSTREIPDLYDEGVSEPQGGEAPCLLPLFEDW